MEANSMEAMRRVGGGMEDFALGILERVGKISVMISSFYRDDLEHCSELNRRSGLLDLQ